MPKRAIIRKTVRVKPGGKVVNRPNWPCLIPIILGALLLVGGCAGAVGETALLLGCAAAAAAVYGITGRVMGR